MLKKLIRPFDKLEDIVRHRLSKTPIIYALIGGIGIVLFWRGVWHLADDFGMSSLESFIASLIILLMTGTFVSFFIGEQILISGLKEEKRIDQKTEEDIRYETRRLSQVREEIDNIEKTTKEIKKDIAFIKEELQKK